MKLTILKANIYELFPNTLWVDEGIAFARIVIPILEECQHLKEIELQHMMIPRDFITRIFDIAKESIFVYLNPRIGVDSCGTFEEITNGVKNSPYLIDLTIPWPHGPEKLSFRVAHDLALSCEDLEMITFRTSYYYPRPYSLSSRQLEILGVSRYEMTICGLTQYTLKT